MEIRQISGIRFHPLIPFILAGFTLTLFRPYSALCEGRERQTRACAHRGDVLAAPENTIPAFESAVRKGAHQIEFDLRLSLDDKLILIHDETLDRTTNGSGKVSEATFELIRKLDAGSWFSDDFSGTQVPTFREALEVIPRDILCNCHLKGPPKIGAKAAQAIVEMGREDQCFLAATIDQARAAKRILPTLRICNMSRQAGPGTTYPDQTIELQCEFIQLLGSLDGLKETVKKLHTHNITVNFFHGNTEERIRALADAGVDYILTDNLDLCLEVLNQ